MQTKRPWKQCGGIIDVAAMYDIFVLDQWGVLHDGVAAIPQAFDAIQFLRNASKNLVVLTNSGKSTNTNFKRLSKLGFGSELFDAVVTSGEAAADFVADRHPGKAIFWIDFLYDDHVLQKFSGNSIVGDVESADLIFLSGWNPTVMLWEGYERALIRAVEKGIPMVCANPDKQGFVNGEPRPAAGWLADKFQKLGGAVTSFGKPDPRIFRSCLHAVGAGASAPAIVVGDSFETDICGASRAGLDSMLICGGIHRELFSQNGLEHGMRTLCEKFGQGTVTPRFVMERLRV